MDKILSPGIQDLPGWAINGITAENNHFKVRAGFMIRGYTLSPVASGRFQCPPEHSTNLVIVFYDENKSYIFPPQ
ncbi:MAG: hypothetical protein MUO68_22735 [Desulfobacteraceae bacterium]|nr:hypothetical protein [Desulfobacteraceae bacterium]